MSIMDNIRSLFAPRAPTHTAKNFSMSEYSPYGGVDYVRGGDLRGNDHGLAVAFSTVVAVNRATTFWMTNIGNLRSGIYKRDADGNEIELASSDDRDTRHGFYGALNRHYERYYYDLIPRMVYSDVVHGETYVERIYFTRRIGTDFRWLNPIGVDVDINSDGEIYRYQYNSAYGTMQTLTPEQVAYRIWGVNPFDDLHGSGMVAPALSSINIDRNLKRYLIAFFRNNALPIATVSPANEVAWNDSEVRTVREYFTRLMRGIENTGSMLVFPKEAVITTFDLPDIEKYYTLHDPTIKEIMMQMGIPPSIAGDPSLTKFHDGDPVMRNWWLTAGTPYARDLERFINVRLMPHLDPFGAAYFKFDLDKFAPDNTENQTQAVVVQTDLNSGIITLNQARIARGYDPDDRLEDLVLVNGTPTPIGDLARVSQTLPERNPFSALEADDDPTPDHEEHTHHPHTEPFEPPQDTPEDELKAWRTVATKNYKRTFEPYWLRGDVADVLLVDLERSNGDPTAVRTAFDRAYAAITTKAIQATRSQFETEFEDILASARLGDIDRRRFSTLLRNIIRKYGRAAYIDGLVDGGVKDGETNDEDEAEITRLIMQQSPYVTDFGATLYDTKAITDAEAANKPAMWFNKSIQPFYEAGLVSADKNGMYEWVLGKTEEHCKDCSRFNTQRHRYKTWYAKSFVPGSDLLACEGFNCDCRLVKVFAQARGRLKNKEATNAVY